MFLYTVPRVVKISECSGDRIVQEIVQHGAPGLICEMQDCRTHNSSNRILEGRHGGDARSKIAISRLPINLSTTPASAIKRC